MNSVHVRHNKSAHLYATDSWDMYWIAIVTYESFRLSRFFTRTG